MNFYRTLIPLSVFLYRYVSSNIFNMRYMTLNMNILNDNTCNLLQKSASLFVHEIVRQAWDEEVTFVNPL